MLSGDVETEQERLMRAVEALNRLDLLVADGRGVSTSLRNAGIRVCEAIEELDTVIGQLRRWERGQT